MTPKTSQNPIPYFKPSITDAEINEVLDCLHSGWLTTGKRCKTFEDDFCDYTGGVYAIALSSATAALHLAVEALGLKAGQVVLVPTMTFAATAEIVRYQGAHPLLVDCDEDTLLIDLNDAQEKIKLLRDGKLPIDSEAEVVGIIPVHYGGQMVDMNQVNDFAKANGDLWVVEDSAHTIPAAYRTDESTPWQYTGSGLSSVTCFSFYANKAITTGEGGMAVTNSEELATRIRSMSLHGLSHDAWKRFENGANWDYRIVAPGYKYNLTDIAASIGIHQLRRADELHRQRSELVRIYDKSLADFDFLATPTLLPNRIHSWHLYPIQLQLEKLTHNRNQFVDILRKEYDIGCSVHWRPLHLHTYYKEMYEWSRDLFPVATRVWPTLISLPLYPGMDEMQVLQVASVLAEIAAS